MINRDIGSPPVRVPAAWSEKHKFFPVKREDAIREALRNETLIVKEEIIPRAHIVKSKRQAYHQSGVKGEEWLSRYCHPDKIFMFQYKGKETGGQFTRECFVPPTESVLLELPDPDDAKRGIPVSGNDIISFVLKLSEREQCGLRFGVEGDTMRNLIELCSTYRITEITRITGDEQISAFFAREKETYKTVATVDENGAPVAAPYLACGEHLVPDAPIAVGGVRTTGPVKAKKTFKSMLKLPKEKAEASTHDYHIYMEILTNKGSPVGDTDNAESLLESELFVVRRSPRSPHHPKKDELDTSMFVPVMTFAAATESILRDGDLGRVCRTPGCTGKVNLSNLLRDTPGVTILTIAQLIKQSHCANCMDSADYLELVVAAERDLFGAKPPFEIRCLLDY